MEKKSYPLADVYRLLEPGPVMLVSSRSRDRANIMSRSWHTMIEFEPPLVGCMISNRNYTFDILNETRECVINIPTVALAVKVVGCGNIPGREVNKFENLASHPLRHRASWHRLSMCAMPVLNAGWLMG